MRSQVVLTDLYNLKLVSIQCHTLSWIKWIKMYIWSTLQSLNTSKSTYYFQPWKILSFFHLSMACVWHSEESKFCRHKAQDAYSHYFVAYSHYKVNKVNFVSLIALNIERIGMKNSAIKQKNIVRISNFLIPKKKCE